MKTVSIIISTYNRAEILKDILNSLLNQETDGSFDYEVIMVDNNSQDNTKAVVESFKPRFNDRLKYLFEPRQGKSYALNTGIAKAQGEILAFTDDDITFDKHWLTNIEDCFRQYGCDGVGGRVLPLYPPQTPQWIKDNAEKLRGPIVRYDFGEGIYQYKKPHLEFWGANFAFKRRVFADCGLFRTDIGPGQTHVGDDTEFVNRALNAGKILFYCGKALVWHPVELKRTNLRYIAKWNIELGRYRFIVDDKEKLAGGCYWFGVPRYLVRLLIKDFFACLFSVFNRRKLLDYWIRFFINWGQAAQIRKLYNQQRKV